MILSHPRGIILFSDSTVCIYHSLARTDIVMLMLLAVSCFEANPVMLMTLWLGIQTKEILHWMQNRTSQQATTYHRFPTFSNHFATLKALHTEKHLYPSCKCVMGA